MLGRNAGVWGIETLYLLVPLRCERNGWLSQQDCLRTAWATYEALPQKNSKKKGKKIFW
jgi:hypothetical protein